MYIAFPLSVSLEVLLLLTPLAPLINSLCYKHFSQQSHFIHLLMWGKGPSEATL